MERYLELILKEHTGCGSGPVAVCLEVGQVACRNIDIADLFSDPRDIVPGEFCRRL